MNKLFLWIAAVSAFVLQSCEKTDGIQDEIDSLRDRVAALESKVGDVNSGIAAFHQLLTGKKVIVGVQETDKGYVIEMSDGSQYPVIEGEKLDVLVPVLGIDDEGYWTVSLDNGATVTRIKDGEGKDVSAWPVVDGEHQPDAEGITPQLRVSGDGAWEVSYDGGSSWSALLQDGNPVNAVGENVVLGYSSVFKTVTYDEENHLFTVELVTGETCSFPVSDNFDLTIVAEENETFFLGETRQFEVVQTNVTEAMIIRLEGWKAVLDETTLTVTAPSQVQAQTDFTLSIAATSKEG